jgi:hypothetical protein
MELALLAIVAFLLSKRAAAPGGGSGVPQPLSPGSGAVSPIPIPGGGSGVSQPLSPGTGAISPIPIGLHETNSAQADSGTAKDSARNRMNPFPTIEPFGH